MGVRRDGENDRSGTGGLEPKDQLLAIFVVNVILAVWVGMSFSRFHEPAPILPTWMYWAEAVVLVLSAALSLMDAWWPRLRRVAEDRDGPESIDVNESLLKVMVIALTALDILILWRLAEETGGVLSPYAPFLPAPAIFASFVTKKWQTIVALSIAVAIFIWFSTMEIPHPLPDIQAYQGSAAVMVILAGLLSAIRARVAGTGQSLTSQWSVLTEDRDRTSAEEGGFGDDDDDLPSPASP